MLRINTLLKNNIQTSFQDDQTLALQTSKATPCALSLLYSANARLANLNLPQCHENCNCNLTPQHMPHERGIEVYEYH